MERSREIQRYPVWYVSNVGEAQKQGQDIRVLTYQFFLGVGVLTGILQTDMASLAYLTCVGVLSKMKI